MHSCQGCRGVCDQNMASSPASYSSSSSSTRSPVSPRWYMASSNFDSSVKPAYVTIKIQAFGSVGGGVSSSNKRWAFSVLNPQSSSRTTSEWRLPAAPRYSLAMAVTTVPFDTRISEALRITDAPSWGLSLQSDTIVLKTRPIDCYMSLAATMI